jgi:uncharacterized tellurite resistance protein B-like protein
MGIRQWLGLDARDITSAEDDGLREIERKLDTLDPARARFVACFAYLLARVARADQEVSPVEARTMERILEERGALPRDQAVVAVQLATAHGLRFGGTEDFLVAREFERMASDEEKVALIDCLFAVSASDSSIRTLEDNEVQRVAAELRLVAAHVMAIRAQHTHHLAARKTM